jgi:localization factor PodJL
MNGSRSAPPRHGDRSSLDALNRTIEGLEARIQGLMAGAGRSAAAEQKAEGNLAYGQRKQAVGEQRTTRDDIGTLQQIRERQRVLEQSGYAAQRSPVRPETRQPAPTVETPHSKDGRYATPVRRETVREAMASAATRRQQAPATHDLTDALAIMKRDIADGVSREMRALREEIRSIKTEAEESRFAQNVQSDLARLAEGIDQLAVHAMPETKGLRSEFEELRAVMDGLAREASLKQMQSQWTGIEERIHEADASALKEELVTLAYRVDDIRNQLGLMAESPVIRGLEQKLLNLAGMMEKLGARMQPGDTEFADHFGMLDQRLDEISRAIAANSRGASAADDAVFQRLDGRLSALFEHVEALSHSAADTRATDDLSLRLELLAGKIEELAGEQATTRLEERVEQLTAMIQELQAPGQQAELADILAEISHKIDALDRSHAVDGVREKLDHLASRLDEIALQPVAQDIGGEAAIMRLEDRLVDIAAKLDEASAAPRNNDEALRGLESQIAHLSTLISQPGTGSAPAAWPVDFDERMATIEGYMATSDEYIVEAARQAAEAVVEAYARNLSSGSINSGADIAALSGLAEDLKHLEDLTRGSETRTHQTFEALHDTLVQIADRLDRLEGQISGDARPIRSETVERAPMFASAAPAPRETAAMAAPALSTALAEQMARADVGDTDARLKETSAIGSTMGDYIPENAQHDDGEDDIEVAAETPRKTGLLAGLTRRFRSAPKADAPAPARTVVEPAPSIDPSDVLPPERENDLLEPGSGAPDVKKILERVRASQAAGEFDREKAGERADYIAAARRAAKAAAQEADPSQLGSMGKTQGNPGKGKGGKSGSTFFQHRRPILMAVGAVLLALMAMPLIKTVTTGTRAPQVASVESTANPARPADEVARAPEAAPAPVAEAPAADVARQDPNTVDNGPAGLPPAEDTASQARTEDTAAADPVVTPPVAHEPAAEAPSETAAAEQPLGPITVPIGIEPASLVDAATAGDANALFEIGARFTDGRGVQADPAEAAKWYRLAADRGLPPAQYRLGNLLEKGTGIERNLDEAMTYYRQAAEAGNASAMHNLAVLYASGAAGQPDYAAAVEWFRNAADLGVADSQFNLAILYARGNGAAQDLEESYKWFGVAAKGGDTDAAAKRDEVAKAMRKEQLDSARGKLDTWAAKPLDPQANAVNLPEEWASGAKLTTASVDMTKAIRNIQAILNKNGFDAGTPDGKMGQKTTAAIKAFQSSIGQEPSGKVNDALVRELLARNS